MPTIRADCQLVGPSLSNFCTDLFGDISPIVLESLERLAVNGNAGGLNPCDGDQISTAQNRSGKVKTHSHGEEQTFQYSDLALTIVQRLAPCDRSRCGQSEPNQSSGKAITARLRPTICNVSKFNSEIDDPEWQRPL